MLPEIVNIWTIFNEKNVRYLTIGGLAVNIYGYTRNTGDIDILLEDTTENRINLRAAFKQIGIGDFPQIETMQFVAGYTDFTISYDLRLDVMTSIKGLENANFDELLQDYIPRSSKSFYEKQNDEIRSNHWSRSVRSITAQSFGR